MKSTKTYNLEKCISEFISGTIDGTAFEQKYSEIFDFENDEVDINYFGVIRGLLEHFSPYDTDLNNYSQFYINEKQLRERIIALKSKQ